MFELPLGTIVSEPITLVEGELQAFAHGAISTYVGRRKTPIGHRLVRGGRIVAWMVEDGDKKVMLGGAEARTALEAIESEKKFVILRCRIPSEGLAVLLRSSRKRLSIKLTGKA